MTERSVGSYSTSEEIEHEIRRVQEELTEAKYLQENLTLVHGLARDVLQHIQQDRSRSRPNAYQRAANICGAASCACAPPQQCHQMCISPQMYQQFVNDAGAYIRNMGNNSTTPSHNIVDSVPPSDCVGSTASGSTIAAVRVQLDGSEQTRSQYQQQGSTIAAVRVQLEGSDQTNSQYQQQGSSVNSSSNFSPNNGYSSASSPHSYQNQHSQQRYQSGYFSSTY